MGHILRASIQGNPNIGLYAFVNDEICLVGKEMPDKLVKEIKATLKVPVHKVSVAGTGLIGVFLNGNNKVILAPNILFNSEIEEINKITGGKLRIIETKFTALGNNILSNDNGCMISQFEKDAQEQIEKAFNMEPKTAKVGEIEVIGSCFSITNHYGYGHPDVKKFEKEFIEDTLKIKITEGTVTMGNPFVSSGLLVNKNGFVAGSITTGIELSQIDNAFGFLEEK